MTCNCSTQSTAMDNNVVDALNQAYEFLGMPNLTQRFRQICSVASDAALALEKSERALNLGMLAGSSDRLLLATRRQRDSAVRLMVSFRASIDEYMKGAEWKKALEIINTPDPRHGDVNKLLDELSEEANDQLLNSDLSPAMCLEVRNSLNRAIAIGRQGIEPTMQLLVQSIAAFENELLHGAFEARINRLSSGGSNSPVANTLAEYVACTLAAVAFLIGATIACNFIQFCWCCVFPLLLAGFLAWIAACQRIPRN